MSSAVQAILLLLLAVALWHQLQRDYFGGLSFAAFLMVSMPTYFRINLPGDLPELTVHRMVLVVLVAAWIRSGRSLGATARAPLWGGILFLIGVNFISLCCTTAPFGTSLKRILDLAVEVGVFYLVIASSLRTREDALRIIRAALLGLTFVASLAWVEKYAHFSVVDRLFSDFAGEEARNQIRATYQQRILLGCGMAMGWPLAVGMLYVPLSPRRRILLLRVSIVLMLGACYFAQSRGPWLASALAFGTMLFLGTTRMRKQMALVACLAGLLFVCRPGVWETISGLAEATTNKDTHKGGTFQYRLELWRVAFTKVVESPVRLLVGFGPGAGRGGNLEWHLSYRDRSQQIESWDNHFAYELFQFGFLGLFAFVGLYGRALTTCLNQWQSASPVWRELAAGLLTSVLVLVFMMSNVLIFVKNLSFLFWTLIAAVAVLGIDAQRHPSHEEIANENSALAKLDEPGFVANQVDPAV